MAEERVRPPSESPRSTRRCVLAALALAPLLARAQAAAPGRKRLALVGFRVMFPGEKGLDAVVRHLAALGWVEGRNLEVLRVVIEADKSREQGRAFGYLVPEIQRLALPGKPDAIVTLGSIMTKGAQLATRTIPIVGSVADPVDMGIADSLARPGRNVTGVAAGVAEVAAKTMEFVKGLVPRLSRLAIFHDPRPMATRHTGHYERAARAAGIEPELFGSINPDELVRALRDLPPGKVQVGLLAWFPGDGGTLLKEATARRLPMVGVDETSVEAGCLVSYFAADMDIEPRLAALVSQVLGGADPATIPFEFPRQFRLVINKRAAAALGFAVPPDLLLRADRVID